MPPRSKVSVADLPAEVLVCLALTPLAWLVSLGSQIMVDGTISLVQLGMAGLCSLVVFSLKGWGRWLCLAYDLLLVGLLLYQIGSGAAGAAMPLIQATAFAVAGAALFWPATSRAFRQAKLAAQAAPVVPEV